jgi:pectinesterase
LGKHILPEGWNPWKGDAMFPDKEKTTYYAEYGNKGLGASTKEGYRGQISLLKKMQSFTP